MSWSKPELVDAWESSLRKSLEELEAAQVQARAGTRVDGDHRPENRGERAAVTSQGYLAQGLARRIEELQASLVQVAQLDRGARARVSPGALIQVEDEGGDRSWFAILPGGQGDRLEREGHSVTVISARAPLARALGGLQPGEAAELVRRGEPVEFEVLQVL